MANESRVSDEDWSAARRRWENGEASIKKIADSIGVSKSLVMKRKAAEGWQLRIGVAPVPVGGAAQANSKVTENAGDSERQAPSVTGHGSDTAQHREPSRVVGDVFVAPSDRSAFANHADELKWIEQQVAARQRALMERHGKELTALTAAIYDGLKKIDKKGIGEASRAANALSMAMRRKHAMELEHEAARTRIELGAHYGAPGPRPAHIIVNMVPGVRFGAPDVAPADVINMEGKA